MDIIVTIPKKERSNQKKEDEFVGRYGETAVQFWSIRNKPKKLNIGDRVYFIENGFITCYHIFMGYTYDPVCEVTGRVWSGLNLLLKCPPIYLKDKIKMKGFQYFHYTERFE